MCGGSGVYLSSLWVYVAGAPRGSIFRGGVDMSLVVWVGVHVEGVL